MDPRRLDQKTGSSKNKMERSKKTDRTLLGKIGPTQTPVGSIQGGVPPSRGNTNRDDDDDDDDCSSCNTTHDSFTNFINGEVFIPKTAFPYSLCCYNLFLWIATCINV